MICPDVNVLVYAHRRSAPEHDRYRDWLERVVGSGQPYALSEVVLAGFLRVATNRKAFVDASPIETALAFVESLRSRRAARPVRPGPRHWGIFVELCRTSRVTGGLVADAHHAAVAIEHGLTWATSDGDFARFAGLVWVHPLAARELGP